MTNKNDLLKAEMIDQINAGGAWFCTNPGNYLKIIGFPSKEMMYARECVVKDGTLIGGAYTFSTDWFDISIHGKFIDIYVDPDTLKYIDIKYDPERATLFKAPEESRSNSDSIYAFCAQADREALAGDLKAFHIHSAGFARNLEISSEELRSKEHIFSMIDIVEKDGKKIPVNKPAEE